MGGWSGPGAAMRILAVADPAPSSARAAAAAPGTCRSKRGIAGPPSRRGCATRSSGRATRGDSWSLRILRILSHTTHEPDPGYRRPPSAG